MDARAAAGPVEIPGSASIHNLRFIIRLTEEARAAILDGTFDQYKENFLKDYYQKNA